MSLNKKIKKQMDSMPKYQIQDEAFDNQAIARTRAGGRDRAYQMEEENIDASAQEAIGQAKDVTSSTSGLLSTIAAIESGKQQANRGLVQDEAQLKTQKVQELYGANNAMIDEKDKAFQQNVYAPWDMKIRALREKKANRQQLTSQLIGAAGTIGGALIGGPAGAAIGGKISGAFKRNNDISPESSFYESAMNGI